MAIKSNFSESFKWFLLAGGCLTIAWLLVFYVPYVPLKVFSLLMVGMGIFALWQCYRTARVYRAGYQLITAGIAFIFLTPMIASPIGMIIASVVEVVAEWAFGKNLNLLRKAPFNWSRPPELADLFHAIVGFGLIFCGWKLREETTTVLRINSEEEITQRIEKH